MATLVISQGEFLLCDIIFRAEVRILLWSPAETTQACLCTLVPIAEGSVFGKYTCCGNSVAPASGFIQRALHNPRLNTHEGGSVVLIPPPTQSR